MYHILLIINALNFLVIVFSNSAQSDFYFTFVK